MSEEDERKRAAVHDVVGAGGDVLDLVRPWGKAKAQEILNQVMSDYVTELNRSLAESGDNLYGIDARSFMDQYGALWEAKLAL